jgi:hypothetical protein
MLKQARLETLRDLIVSKQGGAVIGKAIGSDEVKRELTDLREEYHALKLEVHAEQNERAERARKEAMTAAAEQRRRKVRELAKQPLVALHARRTALKAVIFDAQDELAEYSAAVSFLEAGERLKTLLATATDEEREALAALQEG